LLALNTSKISHKKRERGGKRGLYPRGRQLLFKPANGRKRKGRGGEIHPSLNLSSVRGGKSFSAAEGGGRLEQNTKEGRVLFRGERKKEKGEEGGTASSRGKIKQRKGEGWCYSARPRRKEGLARSIVGEKKKKEDLMIEGDERGEIPPQSTPRKKGGEATHQREEWEGVSFAGGKG